MPLDPPHDPHYAHRLAIGARIRSVREQASLTQERLGELVDADRKTIHRIEYAASDPRLSLLIRIARALDVDLADLLRT